MSDLWNQSIIASPLYRALGSSESKSAPADFKYELRPAPKPFAKHFHSQKPDIGINQSASANTKIVFSPPRYGLASIFYLKVSIATNVNAVLNPSGILSLIKDSVTLVAGNNMLECLYPDAIMNRISKLSEVERISMLQAIGSNGTIAIGGSVFYIPLYFSFSESPTSFLDLSFIEQLQLKFTINAISACTAVSTAITSIDINLQINTIVPDPLSYIALKKSQFSTEEPLSLLWHNEYKEALHTATAIGTSVTFSDITLKCNKLCRSTVIQVYQSGTNGAYFPISSLTFQTMNETIFEGDDTELTVMQKRPWNNFLHTRNSQNDFCYELNYDLSGSYVEPSGGLGMKNLNTPTLNVTATSVSNGIVYTLSVIHNYFNVVNISGEDGAILRGMDV